MKPAIFSYHRPSSLDEALSLLGELGSRARILTGGQSLAPMLNLRLARPEHIIDLNDLTEFSFVRDLGESIGVGGLTRHYQLAESCFLQKYCPLVPLAAKTIGHYAIRQRGTLGGSLANADPVAQLPLIAIVLDAQLTLAKNGGRRDMAVSEFFQAAMTTALAPEELILSVQFPKFQPNEAGSFRLFARRHGDFAIVSVAATLTLQEGYVKRIRLALGGIGAVPVRVDSLVHQFTGLRPTVQWAQEVADAVGHGVQPQDDERIQAAYKKELARSLTLRAVLRTLEKLGVTTHE